MGWLTFRLALSAHRLFLHHGYSRPIHLHVQDRDRFAHHDGQIQLHGSLNLCLLARGDILAYGFRCPLHGFGGDLQTGEQFHLLTPVVEGCRRSHHGEHAARSGGYFRFLHIQFHIGRELSLMASRTQVIWAR